jgi:hypothetical protein
VTGPELARGQYDLQVSQNGLCDRHMSRMSYVERAEKFDPALSAA